VRSGVHVTAGLRLAPGAPPSTVSRRFSELGFEDGLDDRRPSGVAFLVRVPGGRSGPSRMIFGSVTENVIQLVKKTPILLVG
jgi:nucleotide-binding universal stress UspA family protein